MNLIFVNLFWGNNSKTQIKLIITNLYKKSSKNLLSIFLHSHRECDLLKLYMNEKYTCKIRKTQGCAKCCKRNYWAYSVTQCDRKLRVTLLNIKYWNINHLSHLGWYFSIWYLTIINCWNISLFSRQVIQIWTKVSVTH